MPSERPTTFATYRRLIDDFIEEVRKRLDDGEKRVSALEAFRAVVESKKFDARFKSLWDALNTHRDLAAKHCRECDKVAHNLGELRTDFNEHLTDSRAKELSYEEWKKLKARTTRAYIVAGLGLAAAIAQALAEIL